ncbi:hypothetical protein [Hymenobacter algoricola]|uniref:OmpA family protein n=1 Tax=Hymenobacter algoricola TaxID=486267 RepID=UPI0031E99952
MEINPPKPRFCPAVLTLRTDKDATVTGVLYEEEEYVSPITGTFQVRGRSVGSTLQLAHVGQLQQTGPEGTYWCQGTISLTYDAAEEKLSGRATYRPVGTCHSGLFTFYRLILKSPAAVTAGTVSTLRVSGRDVRWFADAALQHPIAQGNSYSARLTKATTFYLTQGFYPTSRRTATPITVGIAVRPQQRPSAAPSRARVPAPAQTAVLPTVLFRTATADLLPDSGPALDQLAAQLKAQPVVRLRIAGHPDRIGEPAKNLVL